MSIEEELQLITVKVKREDVDFVKISFHNYLNKSQMHEVVLDTDTALDMSYVIKNVVLDS
tara:strand:- start:368 stop:547 length:180 start_codon:yes stop_codon:yes gene_type:complete